MAGCSREGGKRRVESCEEKWPCHVYLVYYLQCVQGWKGLGGYSVTVPLGVLLISETMLFMMDGCTRTRRQTPNAVDHRYLQIPTLDSMLSSASTGFKLGFSCVPTLFI